ncbi:segregation/condensation protein A [Streptomyces lavendulae]
MKPHSRPPGVLRASAPPGPRHLRPDRPRPGKPDFRPAGAPPYLCCPDRARPVRPGSVRRAWTVDPASGPTRPGRGSARTGPRLLVAVRPHSVPPWTAMPPNHPAARPARRSLGRGPGAAETPAEGPGRTGGDPGAGRAPGDADGPATLPEGPAPAGDGRFTLRLANFEGPFDLLLQLISRHKLDVTEVALSRVTDEFMAHIRAMGPEGDLDQTTEFLVVAATLLDLKAARLLPAAEVEDEADLALLEARDLLFARLLQYRAYKQIAAIFETRAEDEGRRYPRTVGLEPHHAELLPDVVIAIGADGFARLAVRAMQPKAKPEVYVDHIHAPLVSVREQAGHVVRLLKARGEATFQELTEDAPDTLTVVARFLALLELYREKAVVLDQEDALLTLTVRWSGGDGDGMPTVTDEFDQVVEVRE